MLTVYRASAGAGKTHKLTGEYLKLLFAGATAYRHILAVTFTNKATDEMKGRIIEELHRLSSGQSSQYVRELSSVYGMDERSVRAKAKSILTSILHDYGAFNISTIDRFFQQTMRAFTREIGMQGGYAIEMDQDLVLSAAVDNLLGELEKPESKNLLEWLLRFASEKVESGAAWSPRNDIISLGKELFRENYKASCTEVNRDIEDKNVLDSYRNELYAIVESIKGRAKKLGERGMNLMERFGLQPSDFTGASKSQMFFFRKLAKGDMAEPSATFKGFAGNVDKWYKKGTKADMVAMIESAYNGGMSECVEEVVKLFEDMTGYHTAKEILRFYYTLGILTDVSNQIAAYRSEKNIMLIADTTELLSRIIDGSDTPFIYEKTGTRIDNYMIDEFQDTSRMQWNNFRPLLGESLAHGRSNLVVGDVKQSIYRFRNSDWKLLDEQIQKDFRDDQLAEETLEDNWRSAKEIINFNNCFFETAPQILQSVYNEALDESSLTEEDRLMFRERIIDAYSHSSQSIPKPLQDSAGHVSISFIEEDGESNWKEESLERLPATLEHLQDKGYSLQDIAILVRTNREGALVADSLLAYREEHGKEGYRYDIISDDALYVGSSSTVRFLISMLRYLNTPGSTAYRRIAVFACYYLMDMTGEGVSLDDFPDNIEPELELLSKYALYETVEGLFRLFSDFFPENEQVFVQAFLDMVLEFSQKENADSERFLKWWDDTGCRKTIATPDGQNAIRILTIHKSKGLGFKVVIIPFCDWEIDHKTNGGKTVILWCRPLISPFNKLHLVPLNYSSKLALTHFAKDYFEERLQAGIDNLNMLYVAFTRAKEELIAVAPLSQGKNAAKVNSIAGLLRGSLESGFGLQAEDLSLELGYSSTVVSTSDRGEVEEIQMGKLFSVSPSERLKLRLHGKDFMLDDKKRKHGSLMHDILSAIRTSEDIYAAVESYRMRGIVDRDEATDIVHELEQLMLLPEAAAWFDCSSKVMNEVEILSGGSQVYRPDRVVIKENRVTVIDYKFGEMKSPAHHRQVRNYMQLISRMGYGNVEGYLWYVNLRSIEAVSV